MGDFYQLYACLKSLFDLDSPLQNHEFIINSKNIKFGWSKEYLIDFIEKQKCSIDNPVRISDIRRGVKRSYMEMLGLLLTSSKLGEPDEFYKLQTIRPICLNHHPPYVSSTVPVSLHCSIFGKFKDFCEEAPKVEDNHFIYNICKKMADFFKSEEERQTIANKMLSTYFGYEMQPLVLLRSRRTDGTISYSFVYCGLNMEFKWEDCCSNASLYLENCGYFLNFCKEKEKEHSFHVTNFPCFLVTIAGPYFSVSGTVLSDIAIIDLLTPIYPLIWQKDNEMMVSISRTFRALKKSLKLLEEHYKHVDELAQDIPRTAHPVHSSFPDIVINGKRYSVQFDSDPQLLADAEYASKVFATSVIPGNWLLVYMERLDNHSMLSHIAINLNNQERDDLKKKIKIVVKYLHDSEHVHGDLREGNILVRQLENNEFDVKLIDFECRRWETSHEKPRYSYVKSDILGNKIVAN
ncbi:10803_t:CDS:2 [Racocetra persica]|uniref:10803_t:CDS:1 n=1 Tax=Racocetra persica TaxID=160502 RepID=A0ACA9NJI9_9GLOM|nr:10803_t:CDS:2 [Racocetra persica]